MQNFLRENLELELNRSLCLEDFLRRLFLVELKSENLDGFLAASENLQEEFKKHKFIKEFAKCKEDKNLLDEIRYEFNTLFVGPRRPKAVPYESAYFEYKTMFSKRTMQVREFYESIGLKVEGEKFDKFPDDFIGYELEALYFLSFRALEEFKNENEARAYETLKAKGEFINSHPRQWFGEFCAACNGSAKLEIWKNFGDFLTLYLQKEIKNLQI
ncbi:TorD/DmsD family molecular chaperone [Campylobacter curvus]|uniref:TorD/DmsD family molecular chaperone n=1 Tax=Campylobacter curvus TaxID=200 RepID=UPI00037BDB82|nr:molecular chaperone TorD family protein [Campylobacter curvus]QKF60660.1 reductase assembly protein [Campylobacter curvus]UEB48985.1 molecular chaperone TorD family protein [Campylobacter curvus]